jgi:5'-phosphate synthase pdxT subunit
VTAVGVLALQGGFDAHRHMLETLGVRTVLVRDPAALCGLAGLVLPGGESSALLHLMGHADWDAALTRFHGGGGALFGTCAGAILLAREVRPAQRSLGLLDVAVARNAYGRQNASFETALQVGDRHVRAVFIRAPRLLETDRVDVLARHGGEAVLVRQGRVMAATFHPELTNDTTVHALWIDTCVQHDAAALSGGAA